MKAPKLNYPSAPHLDECDCCRDLFPLRALVWTGKQILCAKCRAAGVSDTRIWECAWHPQEFGERAWFSDDHQPTTTPPETPTQSHGICRLCAARLGIGCQIPNT